MGHVGAEHFLPLTAANAASAAVSSVSLEILEAELDSNILFQPDCTPDSIAPAKSKAPSNDKEKMVNKVEDEELEGMRFSWTPNPTRDRTELSYDLGDLKEARLQVRDMQGRTIERVRLERNSGEVELDLSSFEAGFYTYRILDEGRTLKTGKLVLTR